MIKESGFRVTLYFMAIERRALCPTTTRQQEAKMAGKKNVRETVREAIAPTVAELGYEIWDVTYSKIGADYHLEITIDCDAGINIEDCERVHRAIDPILDEIDPIEDFYYLEVSSPGIERELRTEEHLSLSVGAVVEARLFAAIDGSKSYVGTLSAFDGESVTLDTPAGEVRLPRESISKLATVYVEE